MNIELMQGFLSFLISNFFGGGGWLILIVSMLTSLIVTKNHGKYWIIFGFVFSLFLYLIIQCLFFKYI